MGGRTEFVLKRIIEHESVLKPVVQHHGLEVLECALHGLLNYGAAFSERCAYVHLFLDECAVVHDGQYQVAVTLVLLNVEAEYLPGELVGGAASGAEG